MEMRCLLLVPARSRGSWVALLTREKARARWEVEVVPRRGRSLGSSPASRLMAWSLDNADIRPGISAERSARDPARHRRWFGRIGVKSCFACGKVRFPIPMAWQACPTARTTSLATWGCPCTSRAKSHPIHRRAGEELGQRVSFLGEALEFVDEVRSFVRQGVEFGPLSFV